MYGDVSSIRQVRLGQDISARSGGETGEQRRPILRLVLAGLALVHDLVLIVVHDRPLVLLLIQLQLLVSIPSPQPKLSLILIYRNHWQNANRVSAHSESSHNPYTHVCKRSHAAPPLPCLHPFRSAARSCQSMRCTNSFHAGSPRKPAPPTCQRAGSFQPFPPETHRSC